MESPPSLLSPPTFSHLYCHELEETKRMDNDGGRRVSPLSLFFFFFSFTRTPSFLLSSSTGQATFWETRLMRVLKFMKGEIQ